MEKVTTMEEKTIVYPEMNINTTPLVVLPPLSEFTSLVNFQQGGQSWTKILMSDNREGYIFSNTKVVIIREKVISDDRGANIYETPSTESPILKRLENGSLFYLLGVVPNTSNAWVKIRDYSGIEGFMAGDTKTIGRPKEGGTQHDIPKCLNCGNIAPWKVEPVLRPIDWGIGIGLLVVFGGGLVFLIITGLIRANPANRGKICSLCGAKNMFTFVYNP